VAPPRIVVPSNRVRAAGTAPEPLLGRLARRSPLPLVAAPPGRASHRCGPGRAALVIILARGSAEVRGCRAGRDQVSRSRPAQPPSRNQGRDKLVLRTAGGLGI
jgi:hypothetical protein